MALKKKSSRRKFGSGASGIPLTKRERLQRPEQIRLRKAEIARLKKAKRSRTAVATSYLDSLEAGRRYSAGVLAAIAAAEKKAKRRPKKRRKKAKKAKSGGRRVTARSVVKAAKRRSKRSTKGTVVTARSILKGAQDRKLKLWVCAGKVRSGCGGSTKGRRSRVVGVLR